MKRPYQHSTLYRGATPSRRFPRPQEVGCVFAMADGRPVGFLRGGVFFRRCAFSRAVVRRLNALALHRDLAESLRARREAGRLRGCRDRPRA